MRNWQILHVREEERGVAIVEAAIVIPLLLFLVYAGIEYSRMLERAQWVSQLSRELANVAYRECSTKSNPVLRSCIQERVVEPLTAQGNLLAPNTEYIVAVYTYEAGAVSEEEVFGSANYMQRFRDAGFSVARLTQEANAQTPGSPGNALRESGLLLVGSAYSPMQTFAQRLLPGMRLFFPDVISSSTLI